MKKIDFPLRKHGYKARAAAIERLIVSAEPESCQSTPSAGRRKTLLTFQTQTQVYLWTTDRGRSRLIKH